jgi:hypothetical protein
MTDREFRKHLTQKRLEAIRADVLVDRKKPPASERDPRATTKTIGKTARG